MARRRVVVAGVLTAAALALVCLATFDVAWTSLPSTLESETDKVHDEAQAALKTYTAILKHNKFEMADEESRVNSLVKGAAGMLDKFKHHAMRAVRDRTVQAALSKQAAPLRRGPKHLKEARKPSARKPSLAASIGATYEQAVQEQKTLPEPDAVSDPVAAKILKEAAEAAKDQQEMPAHSHERALP